MNKEANMKNILDVINNSLSENIVDIHNIDNLLYRNNIYDHIADIDNIKNTINEYLDTQKEAYENLFKTIKKDEL